MRLFPCHRSLTSIVAMQQIRRTLPLLLCALLSACGKHVDNVETANASELFFEAPSSPEHAPGRCTACAPIDLVFLESDTPGLTGDDVRRFARELASVYGVAVRYAGKSHLPAAALDDNRNQHDGNLIVDELRRRRQGSVIALTNADIYLSFKPDWKWAFGGRSTTAEKTVAVISSFRMGSDDARQRHRMAVMLGKYLGSVSCGFEPSDDPKSIMFNKVLSGGDLDRMSARLCYR